MYSETVVYTSGGKNLQVPKCHHCGTSPFCVDGGNNYLVQ